MHVLVLMLKIQFIVVYTSMHFCYLLCISVTIVKYVADMSV